MWHCWTAALACVLLLDCSGAVGGDPRGQISLARVDGFADAPTPWVLMDWRARAASLDNYLASASALDSGFVWWTAANPTPLLPPGATTMAISSYANATQFKPGSSEGLPVMGAVLGAAVARVGLQWHNVTRAEAATLKYVSSAGIFRDFPNAATGGSFWYDVAPSIFAASLSDLFPESRPLRNLTRHSIRKWVTAAETMRYNFTHTAYSFATSSPVNNGKWLEADAAAGISWLAFMGSRASSGADAARQLRCARKSTEALEAMSWNPLYEMQLPFGALTAARLNAEAGGSFDVRKLLNWSLTPNEPLGNQLPGAPRGVTRSGWGAVSGRWGGKTVDGLIGSSLDGGGYAFFGNTAWFFAALGPLPRYDYRFADALGKYLTAVTINARLFYPDQLGERQSGPIDWEQDPENVIPYEGLRKCDYSRPAGRCLHGEAWGPFGTGQNCGDAGVAAGSGKCRPVPTVPYQSATDRGFYGGNYIGLIGGAVTSTSAPRVLQFDLNANDRFAGPSSFPTVLIFNSMSTTQTVRLNASAAQAAFGAGAAVDIYETTTDKVIVTNGSLAVGVEVEVPAGQAIIAVACPARSIFVRSTDGTVSVPDKATGKATIVRFRVPAKTDDDDGGGGIDGGGGTDDNGEMGGIGRVAVDVSASGNFSVVVDGDTWLAGLQPAVHVEGAWWALKSSAAPEITSGSDGIGRFSANTFSLMAGRSKVEFVFRQYEDGQTVVFSVRFPDGADGTRTTASATACKNCEWPTAANNFTGCLGTGQGTQCVIEPATRFPAFSLSEGRLPELGFKTWEFTFGVSHSSGHSSSTGDATEAAFGSTVRRNGNRDIDPAGGAPVVLFEEHDGATLTYGPLDNFMSVVGSVGSGVEWATGVGGEVDSLPAGFELSTLLHLSPTGITDSVLGWGATLRRYHNTSRNVDDDVGLTRLGYWTDNGAYFMLFDWQFAYPTLYPALIPTSKQFDRAGGMAERALKLMSDTFRDLGVPIGYYQLDAWWYQMPCSCAGRCCGATGAGAPRCEKSSDSCILDFTANQTYFPSGLANLSEYIGAGFNLYHHLFCVGNAYEARGYRFDNEYVVPEQSRKFYERLFAQGKAQKQVAFEIDYLSRYAGIPSQRSSLTGASQWLKGMADAAAEAHLPIQYCMQYPRHILESALHPAVTQARASTDYDSPLNFFDFGHIALLNVALDLSPSKDNFRTQLCTECNFGSRTNVEMEAMLACHSRGPVGISDGPGQTDVSLVRRMITSKTGTILRPSRSMFAIDAHYAVNASRRPDGEVWSSHTLLNYSVASESGESSASAVQPVTHYHFMTHFILAVGNQDSSGAGYTLQRSDLKLSPHAPYLVRRFSTDPANGCTEKAPASLCASTWLSTGSGGAPHLVLERQNQSDAQAWSNASRPFTHELWGVYPVLGDGFVLLGELDKFVGVSETRFGAIALEGGNMLVAVRGDPGEVVTVTAAVPRRPPPTAARADDEASSAVSAAAAVATRNCSSSAFENDTDFGGHDLVNFPGFTTAAACCSNCTGTPNCTAWTWAGPHPAAGPPNYCWLKTSAANRGTIIGHTSGVPGGRRPGPPPPPPPPAPHDGYSCAAGVCTQVPGGGAFNNSVCDHQCHVAPPPPPPRPPGPLGTDLALRVLSVLIPQVGTATLKFEPAA